MKNKRTFVARIAVGFREGYTQKVHTIEEAYEICREYCDRVGLCVTVTPTRYIYSKGQGRLDGYEDGCFIELISYPSFVASRYDVIGDARELAKIFLVAFKQNMIAIIASDETYTVDKRDLIGEQNVTI
jgi:hypothetical protein